MNMDNLHELINRYEAGLDWIYGEKHNELFKWRAVKTWQDEWFKPAGSFATFADRFTAAKRNCGLFMDNSRMHPSNGVLKLWEKEPETVERMFNETLFADAHDDVVTVQNHMDSFLDDYEALRQKYYPGNWSYKQDRHSASVLLALYNPSFNYVYKSNNASLMARYIDFVGDIGAGKSFKLQNYYKLCEVIVSALQEHETLLDKHYSYLDERCYVDRSLHLMAFDLMYCCSTYHFYNGLALPVPVRAKKKPSTEPSADELARRDTERIAQIEALQTELAELESVIDDCEDISLIGVQVTSAIYGTGTVVNQAINKIDVQFSNTLKTFLLDKQYMRFPARPHFEDDGTIINAFSGYGQRQDKINSIKKRLEELS